MQNNIHYIIVFVYNFEHVYAYWVAVKRFWYNCCFCGIHPLMPCGDKKVTQASQTCSWKLHACLSMWDLFVATSY